MGMHDTFRPKPPGQRTVYLMAGPWYETSDARLYVIILTDDHTDWRRGDRAEEESRLLSLFADHPEAPFSIHRFVKHGASSCGKYPGEWFGPSATARCIQYVLTANGPKYNADRRSRALSNEYKDAGLNVYITSDSSDVYEDKFRTIAYNKSGQMNPTLILLGTRLGIDRVTPVYWESLKDTLKYPQSVGIAGYVPLSS